MAYLGQIRQWDLLWADLEPAVGSEMKGERRPVLVLSNDGFNAKFRVVTVIPFTDFDEKTRKPYPFEVIIPAGSAGNPKNSLAQPFQVRTLDRMRFLEAPMGRLDDPVLREEIEDRLMDHFGITFDEAE